MLLCVCGFLAAAATWSPQCSRWASMVICFMRCVLLLLVVGVGVVVVVVVMLLWLLFYVVAILLLLLSPLQLEVKVG